MQRMKLVLGDWSDDGHGKYEHVLLEVNKTVEEVQEGYRQSIAKTGVSFEDISSDYQSGFRVTEDNLEKLATAGLDVEQYDEDEGAYRGEYGTEGYTLLFIDFIKLSIPDLECKVVKDDIPTINGYWGKLNVSLGYGLFY